MPAIGPVEPAIRPQEWPVNVAAVAIEVEFADKGMPMNLAVLLFELPEIRMRGGIEGAVMPQHAGGKSQVIGIHGALVEDAVAIGIFQKQNTAKLFLQFQKLAAWQVGAGPLGHEQP